MTEERKRIIELLDEVIDLKKQLLATVKLRAELAAANERANRVEIAEAKIVGLGSLMPLVVAELAAANAVGVVLIADNERLRAALELMLCSARPNPKEHPTMWAAWANTRKVLASAKYPNA